MAGGVKVILHAIQRRGKDRHMLKEKDNNCKIASNKKRYP
jgi:hypothetical protein